MRHILVVVHVDLVVAVERMVDAEEHRMVVGHNGLERVHHKVAADHTVLVVVAAAVRRMAVDAEEVDSHLAVEDTNYGEGPHTEVAAEDMLLVVGMGCVKVGHVEVVVEGSLVGHNPVAVALAADNLEVDIGLGEGGLHTAAGNLPAEGMT